jgi:hypothetical protein
MDGGRRKSARARLLSYYGEAVSPEQQPARFSVGVINYSPIAFWAFLVLHIALSIALGVVLRSWIFFGVLLLSTVPFAWLATAFWGVIKDTLGFFAKEF